MIIDEKHNINISALSLLKDKISYKGVSSLTDDELLSAILSKGELKKEVDMVRASQLLTDAKNLNHFFRDFNSKNHKILGSQTNLLIEVIAEILKRYSPDRDSEKVTVKNNLDIELIMRPIIGGLCYEEFWVIALNGSNKIIDKKRISSGATNSTLVDIKLLMRFVLQSLASSIILVHNHPSETLDPSTEDILLTQKIDSASNTLDIKLLDHVIISSTGALSMRKEGYIK